MRARPLAALFCFAALAAFTGLPGACSREGVVRAAARGEAPPSRSVEAGESRLRGSETPAEGQLPKTDRGVLVFGRAKDSLTLDPAAASDGESAKVIDQIFEGLVRFSDDPARPSTLLPSLATDWECTADRLAWTFRLRKGVRFHDGSLFDAEAVKFSFERILDPGHPQAPPLCPYRSTFARIQEIRVLGPHRIRFFLREPSVVFLRDLAMFSASIVSPKAVREEGKAFGRNPVGTGPFRFVSWKQDVAIRLTRFDGWWGEPPAQGVRDLVFAQVADPRMRLSRLRSGEIQIGDNLGLQDLESLRGDARVRLVQTKGMNVCYLAMNNERPPFTDIRVRQAVARALDRSKILARGFQGFGEAAYDLLPSTVPGHSEKAWPGLDRDRARALLEEAGVDPKKPVRLTVMNNPRPYLGDPERVAELCRDELAKVGLVVKIEKLDWAGFIQKLQQGEHEMALVGWSSDNGDPDNFYGPILSKEAIGATNFVRMRHARFEALLQEAREEAEFDKRSEILKRIQAILARECPCVPLAHAPVTVALAPEVEGFSLHPIRLDLCGVRRTR